jgi:hypothetical protein
MDLDASKAARREARGGGPIITHNGREFELVDEPGGDVVDSLEDVGAVLERQAEVRVEQEVARQAGDKDAVAALDEELGRLGFRSLAALRAVCQGLFPNGSWELFLEGKPSLLDYATIVRGIDQLYDLSMGESEASGS